MQNLLLIRSLALSQSTHRDTFCWNHTMSGQYTLKSVYWVARNILIREPEIEYSELIITNLYVFGWKANAPQKMCHLIWQIAIRHLALKRNHIRHHMCCDNHCSRCGQTYESVTHTIFEFYTDLHYLFLLKNNIEYLGLDIEINHYIQQLHKTRAY